MANVKKRLDVLLVERGLAESRQRAQAVIMSGQVYVREQKVDKAGTQVEENAPIEVRGQALAYVSRGGLKLEKALKTFSGIRLKGVHAIDAGASTGGFTDCMLQNGAEKVYAVDVGYGQLAWSLRSDPRVVCMERTNVRYLTAEQIPEPLDFGTVDVSFISLKLILPALRGILKPDGQVVCLVKPQFEAGREKVGKKGVVRDPAVHLEVLRQFLQNAHEADFTVKEMTFSPIRGPEGNIEYLGHLCVGAASPGTATFQLWSRHRTGHWREPDNESGIEPKPIPGPGPAGGPGRGKDSAERGGGDRHVSALPPGGQQSGISQAYPV